MDGSPVSKYGVPTRLPDGRRNPVYRHLAEKVFSDANRNYDSNRYEATKIYVIDALGGKCVCCGESRPAFLTIGHPNGDGAKHRAELGVAYASRHLVNGDRFVLGGGNMFEYLFKLFQNDQTSNYEMQIECYNCNCGARSNNGICPHKVV
jgi:hypothetical protein